ncbi:MAG: hypothetical protein L3J56_00400 [Bacteroidales bacterium]|nr:hypothetical protein [Bacteroidales bacterium]
MKKINLLDITFEDEIFVYELPAFRGAVIKMVGRENILFHNHLNKDYRFAYPLIQYKRINKKPHILCIEDGVDEAHKFFINRQEGLLLGERPYELKVDAIHLYKHEIKLNGALHKYNIKDWLPLSQKNYLEYKCLDTQIEKIKFLERILIGNILSLAKGISWTIEEELKLNILEIKNTHKVKMKKTERLAFSLSFQSNIQLPNNIGLGRNVSLGFGTVKKMY